MAQTVRLNCQCFQKNDDGSWNSVLVADIGNELGSVRLPPGMTFKKGTTFIGVDVAATLDQQCSK